LISLVDSAIQQFWRLVSLQSLGEGAMEIEKRLRGRPRKTGDTIQFWQFARAGMALCAYDEARGRGEKHSAAVRDVVQFVKQRNPEMHISETETKRILAAWRPRGSQTILRFDHSSMSEEDLKRRRWILEQLAMLRGKKSLTLPTPPNYDLARNVAAFKFRLAERPNYPRHNPKNPTK